METYSVAKQKIEKEILRLQRQMKTLKVKQRRPIITSIVRSMQDNEITIEELTEALEKTQKRGSSTNASQPKSVLPPKFRNPATGDTWTGRGRPPRWILDAEAAGKERSKFLIK